MSIAILLYAIIALCFLGGSRKEQKKMLRVWAGTFMILGTYALLGHSYVHDPLSDYFINVDQVLFYRESLALMGLDTDLLLRSCFSQHRYSESPLAFATFAGLMKSARLLGVSDLLLFVKLNVVFIGSFIPVLIYRIIALYRIPSHYDLRAIFLFVVCSPLLTLAGQMMRDIQVCFLYTWMFFFMLRGRRWDWFYILLLIIVAYFFRVESGLFALSFWGVVIFRRYHTSSNLVKISLIVTGIVAMVFILPTLFQTMTSTLEGYTVRSLRFASEDSLGAQLAHLPFPLNILSKTAFAQLLPFPLWFPFNEDQSYSALRIVECFIPFFWVSVLLSIFYILYFHREVISQEHLLSILIALIFLILTSASEFNTRRLFAVYPILIFIWIFYSRQIKKRTRMNIFIISAFGIVFLNILYIWVK